MRTKAEFRALRELTGITQAQLAKLLGVEVRSVKRWESPNAPQRPPQDAWDALDEAAERQWAAVSLALEKLYELEDETGQTPQEVALPYWPGADEYAERSTDAALGIDAGPDGWRMANANARMLAAILRDWGVPVRWEDGNPARPVNTIRPHTP